jgi:Fe-S-cluster containining protein
MVNSYSFGCSACGKCCNSPPAMALPELFRHRDLFVGCLAISRTPRRSGGERLRVGREDHVLTPIEAAACEALGGALLHKASAHHRHDGFFQLVTQGYDYPSLARCPALQEDGLCAIHASGKPVQCEVVPLDPMLPDALQYLALAGRKIGAAYIGADCIQAGEGNGNDNDMATLVGDGLIHDPAASDAIARRRQMLAMEQEIWGRAVFASLRKELFDGPDVLARIPADGFLTISIAPALLAVAGISENCRQMSLAYIDSQLALIERKIAQALLRRHLNDRPHTRELRGFSDAYLRAREILAVRPQDISMATAATAVQGGDAQDVKTQRLEAYLAA